MIRGNARGRDDRGDAIRVMKGPNTQTQAARGPVFVKRGTLIPHQNKLKVGCKLSAFLAETTNFLKRAVASSRISFPSLQDILGSNYFPCFILIPLDWKPSFFFSFFPPSPPPPRDPQMCRQKADKRQLRGKHDIFESCTRQLPA